MSPFFLLLSSVCLFNLLLIRTPAKQEEEKAYDSRPPTKMSRQAHSSFSTFFFLCIASVTIHFTFCQLPPNQVQIITSISQNLSIPSWNTTDPNPCYWKGVNCTGSAITGISLSKFGISSSGFLSDLCKIDSLQSLDISNNQIRATLDGFLNDCGRLSGLKALDLSTNRFYGALPSLRVFAGLESLDLSSNSLSGAIDLQLDGLDAIRTLNLSGNKFIGSIPTRLGKNLGLEELQLSKNSFSGPVPEGLMNYTNLILLDLSLNNLSGLVPEKIGDLPKLQTLILSSNRFDGNIPQFPSTMQSLLRFSANQNQFTGTIPQGMTKYVRYLDLSFNNLSGPIPSDLLSSPNLLSVDLINNRLEGEIPIVSSKLFRLRLSNNLLTGSIPPSIGQLPNLTYFELEGNRLNGSIPTQLGGCVMLQLLNLATNQLQGPLPKELGKLRQLVVLKLQGNSFSGEIPAEISQFNNLSTINLSNNRLSGGIPSGITNLQRLSILNLGDNMLNGSIPTTISSSALLLELQLGGNKLSGDIPRMPDSLQIALNLSTNLFSGPISSNLSSLTSLEVLDLSNNQFTGEVPQFLTQLVSLTLLVLSKNKLSGTLPQFSSRVTVNSSGNEDLVSPTPASPPTSPHGVSRRKRNLATLVTLVALASAILTIGIVAVVLIMSRRFYRVDDVNPGLEENLPQVINGHLITTDNVHRSSINFTRAMEAVNNPVNIIVKSRFSTYYKALMPCGMTYSVKKLNWSDKIFQLGSHEKFGEELQILGRLSNSRVMIPLAYVLTADNAFLFYEHAHMGTLFDLLHKSLEDSLDWTSRYSIALGVAQGLSFLHGCSDPILLLDLSSKTILLKSLTEPQIADVELCKVIDPSKSTGSLSTVAGSVGYIPPEYAYTMRVTMAGNVYSFGVVLLELLTGKPSVSEGTELAKWVLSKSTQVDAWEQILDSSLSKTSVAVRRQMLSVLKIAQACVSVSPEARPNMKSVMRMLLNAR